MRSLTTCPIARSFVEELANYQGLLDDASPDLAMRRDVGDRERFRFVIPIRELILVMVMGVQNLP